MMGQYLVILRNLLKNDNMASRVFRQAMWNIKYANIRDMCLDVRTSIGQVCAYGVRAARC